MVGNIFFNLFIMPLELLFEIVFSIFYRLFSNPGISILALSLVMNFLVLPLYRRADAIQEEEKDKAISMSRWTDHIKKTFSGDERYMILNTYYRQQNYKPISSLRSTFSLVLQLPFFIAAYHYLSNLSILKGMKFLIFNDLGAPDGLIAIGSLHVNVMPVLMTAINVLSAYVYLRGFPLKNKIQTYAIAAVFLVLLYDSPSGLVFYWTLNQIFSLCKNLIMKVYAQRKKARKERGGAAEEGACREQTGAVSEPGRAASRREAARAMTAETRKPKPLTFILGGIFMTIFLGAVIPLSVISSSPVEFVTSVNTPARIIVNNLCTSAGVFIIWMGIFYYLAARKGRTVMTYLIWMMSIGAVINFFFFGRGLGTMSAYLVFDEEIAFAAKEAIVNIVIAALLVFALYVFMRMLPKIVPYIYAILIIGFGAMCVIDGIRAGESIEEEQSHVISSEEKGTAREDISPILPLSKEGRNVVILMLDRAMNGYIPYMFRERPELADAFDGFTYYPNTLAFAGHTNMAIPAIFGGYDYTPAAMDARDGLKNSEKHAEALKLMPELFTEAGFEATLCDTAYAGYKWVADMSFYDGMEHVHPYTTIGTYEYEIPDEVRANSERIQNRNFFMYSVMKSMPVYTQALIYDEGNYFSTGARMSMSEAFLESYSVLCDLKELTKIEEGSRDNYIFLDNESTHEITLLKTPEYEPGVINSVYNYTDDSYVIDGRRMEMKTERQISHYHVNMASFLKVGEWLEYLKDEGVYDNTRIIVVSDHGYGEAQFEDMIMPGKLDVQWYNAMLLVKDFAKRGSLITDDTFMTTADTPSIAMEGIVEDPVNPYTGNAVNEDPKKEPQLMTTSHNYGISKNNGTTFDTSDGEWFSVHDDIFEYDNWENVTDQVRGNAGK